MSQNQIGFYKIKYFKSIFGNSSKGFFKDTNKKKNLNRENLAFAYAGAIKQAGSNLSPLAKKKNYLPSAQLITASPAAVKQIEFLDTYNRSNQDTCLVHKPAVTVGEWVESGDLLADNSASMNGELAIGQNIIVAYMPWEGFNYEDAILINERLVYDDVYTSVHIERYEIETKAASTHQNKLGGETITRIIPDLNPEATAHLDKYGIASIGSWIEEGDILVGKVTPTNPKSQTPYQRLLFKLLEKKVNTVRDSSLRAPKGIRANVINVQILAASSQTNLQNIQKKDALSKKVKKTVQAPKGDSTSNKPLSAEKKVLLSAVGKITTKKSNTFNKNLFQSGNSVYNRSAVGRQKVSIQFDMAAINNKNYSNYSSYFYNFVSSQGSRSNISKNWPYKFDKSNKSLKSSLAYKKIAGFSDYRFSVDARLRDLDQSSRTLAGETYKTITFKNSAYGRAKEFNRNPNNKFKLNFLSFLKNTEHFRNLNQKELDYLAPEAQHLLEYKINPSKKKDSFVLNKAKFSGPGGAVISNFKFIYPNKIKSLKQTLPTKKAPTAGLYNKGSNLLISSAIGQKKQTYTQKLYKIVPTNVHMYLAEKRKIQVGDKMAGRHGNKGILSNILPRQDMPYLPDGTAVDIVLNPLGVPSRMNVGQIYECLLGLAGKYLGEHYKISPFDEIYGPEASRSFVFAKLFEARQKTGIEWLFDANSPGKMRLFDGRTGECFDQPVTVGIAYMLKLVHMVDDKIHARSTGPYSLVTQQPLRGRAKQGGQRLGEMEVWAIEGYGAAFVLLEMLTLKSDDMTGRLTLWSNLILNKEISIGTPESFKVLVCELQALCLDIGLYHSTEASHYSSDPTELTAFGQTPESIGKDKKNNKEIKAPQAGLGKLKEISHLMLLP